MPITVYGIRNCDKIKRTLAWFEKNKVTVRFHDYRKDGLDPRELKSWLAQVGWNDLINRAGTTWRGLPDDVKAATTTAAAAQRLLAEHPTLIKRPLIDTGGTLHVGYDEAAFRRLAS